MAEIWGEGLSFDDVFLVPGRSSVLATDADLSSELGKGVILRAPILSAAMDTVTESEMAMALAGLGGLGVIHRNLDEEEQADQVSRTKAARLDGDSASGADGEAAVDGQGRLLVGAAVGVGPEGLARADAVIEAGVDVLVVDTAHGHAERVLETTAALASRHPQVLLVSGNVATAEAAEDLIAAGCDVVKVGVGPGSVCTTRDVAGVGMPQITAIEQAHSVAGPKGIPVIADGGMKTSGDMVKALAAGATALMVGSLLAGTAEAPGEVLRRDGRRYKAYRGMGSPEATTARLLDRYAQDREAVGEKLVAEGWAGWAPLRGPVKGVVEPLLAGIRSGMGYVGASSITELHGKARLVRITPAGRRESRPGDIAHAAEGGD
ncbi:MAG: IMP dehydrogenase [Anaerolineae bacterium]